MTRLHKILLYRYGFISIWNRFSGNIRLLCLRRMSVYLCKIQRDSRFHRNFFRDFCISLLLFFFIEMRFRANATLFAFSRNYNVIHIMKILFLWFYYEFINTVVFFGCYICNGRLEYVHLSIKFKCNFFYYVKITRRLHHFVKRGTYRFNRSKT